MSSASTSTTSTAARARTRVGKYQLGRTLGQGSFAKFKFATHSETGDRVAIKVIQRQQILHHRMVEQIKREISTMKMIKHPNVVNLVEMVFHSIFALFLVLLVCFIIEVVSE